jgi:hypothetical protein
MLTKPPEWRSREVVNSMAQAVTPTVLVPDGVALGEVLDADDEVTHKIAGSMELGAWSRTYTLHG